MIVYRLSKSAFSEDLSGKGAEKAGGRWNSKGVAMIYTGSSRALCVAEVAVHLPLGIIPSDYEMVSLQIPDNSICKIDIKRLSGEWRSFPHPDSTQKTGYDFVRDNKHLVLKVPSAVVQGDYNLLINPRHPEIKKVRIISREPFIFDSRMFKR